MSTIKPGDVMLTKSCRMVRVLASRDDGAVAMRDYRSRVAVRSVDTDRLSYHSEHELTLVQPPATPQEPEPYGPFFDPCGKCVTRTHCAHHDRCLAECVPADLRASTSSPEGQTWRAIATVPKDGTRILLTPAVWTAGRVVSAYYRLGMWWIESADARGSIRAFTDPDEDASHWPFTHWTPLPGAPLKVER